MTSDDLPFTERGRIRREARVFGRSVLGAPLQVFEAEGDEVPILVMAGTHGDEGEGVAVLSAALRSLPPSALAADVVLAVNPDGLALGTRGNANGVDLNRNLPAASWSDAGTAYRWTVDAPRDVKLSTGDVAGSEPETQALIALIEEREPELILSIHAPLGVVDDPDETPLGAWLASVSGLPRVADVGYPTPGSFGTWAAERGLPVVTLELPSTDREALVRAWAGPLASVLRGGGVPQ